MTYPTPSNISALIGCLGVPSPQIFVPNRDKDGNPYATWDRHEFDQYEKEMALGIGWLLSGLPAAEGDFVPSVGYNDEPHFKIETTQFAWMVCCRAAALFRAIHEEDAWTI